MAGAVGGRLAELPPCHVAAHASRRAHAATGAGERWVTILKYLLTVTYLVLPHSEYSLYIQIRLIYDVKNILN